MIDNSDGWLGRAKLILNRPAVGPLGTGSEAAQFASSMLSAIYGSESPQLKQFQIGFGALQKVSDSPHGLDSSLNQHARAVIRNTVAELEAGLIVRLRVAVAGEVLGEMIQLAKEILSERTEAAKNAAAVLTAAAYEGLIRKLGEEFASVTGRPKLEGVIGALKTADVLRGGQVATGLGYLKFRNDSLHADWNNVDRSLVEGCLAFSESLLMTHFS